jgi:hypothetical protein
MNNKWQLNELQILLKQIIKYKEKKDEKIVLFETKKKTMHTYGINIHITLSCQSATVEYTTMINQ